MLEKKGDRERDVREEGREREREMLEKKGEREV